MSGLEALLWVCAVGIAVYIATLVIQLIQSYRNRREIHTNCVIHNGIMISHLNDKVKALEEKVDELKNTSNDSTNN